MFRVQDLGSKLRERGHAGYHIGSIIRVIQGDIWSLDYS